MRKISLLAVLLVASAPLALAQGTYMQIDYPGATATQLWGIDRAGDLSGFYTYGPNSASGFLLSGGVYTSVNYPGAEKTYVLGINDDG
jgi:hypothetical protein